MADALDDLAEYAAATSKVDAAVAAIVDRRRQDLACAAGCAQCCVAGLTVLPVEAAAITAALVTSAPPARLRPGYCSFLDDENRCTIYEARPWVCRTHGLPVRLAGASADRGTRALPLAPDVEVCALNFTAAPPAVADILDGTRLLELLTVVDARFRARAGRGDDAPRVSLAALAAAATGTT